MGRRGKYTLNGMDDIISSAEAKRTEKRIIKKPEPEKFVPPDPRCENCHYWKTISCCVDYGKACHYALHNGKLRKKISKTECGSFLDKSNAPKRKFDFDCVPMSQWGCGGVMYSKNGFE